MQLKEVLLKLLNGKQDFPCIMSAGDFNLPSITWEEGLGSLNSTPAYGQELKFSVH